MPTDYDRSTLLASARARLFRKPAVEWTAEETKAVLDIYRMLVDLADKVSQRRQISNSFYLSVNTALVGASAYLTVGGQLSLWRAVMVAVAGILVSVLWIKNINTYRSLNAAKFDVILEIEKHLAIAPLTAEWEQLERGENAKRHRPFHKIEVMVASLMLGVHVVQLGLSSLPLLR